MRAILNLILLAFLFVTTGCRTTLNEDSESSEKTYTQVHPHSLIDSPEEYSGKSISVIGDLSSVKTKKMSDDISVLSLSINDFVASSTKVEQNGNLDFILSKIESTLRLGMDDLDRADAEYILRSSAKIKIAGRRLMSLSSFFYSIEEERIGKAIEDIGLGYENISLGYEDIAENSVRPISEVPELKLRLKGSEEYVEKSEKGLTDISEIIIGSRMNISDIRFSFDSPKLFKLSGHRILSLGHMISSEELERSISEENLIERNRIPSVGVIKIGSGMRLIGEGLMELDSFVKEMDKSGVVEETGLRCLYIGFNKDILLETKKRLLNVQGRHITVSGEFVREDFMGEIGVYFLKIDSIEFDGLKVNVSHNDISMFMYNTGKTYRFMKEIRE
jgi:hypothetical protein